MKVLFAVNNDSISEAIMKKYQRDYKEILSYKNVYYFNAILKELQNNKDYDRIVIAEDLEPFANNNYDAIDKFLFDKLEKINEEAKDSTGTNIEVILICADRRSKSDHMLTKLFEIGMYNALIGDERNIESLCRLMYQPRTKKEAKIAYNVRENAGMYQTDDDNGVSESEVQNILAHYKRLGKNEDKYVDSFNNIVSQYTDAQLKIIIKCLPLHVKAVLEQRSPKYQQLSTFSARNKYGTEINRTKNLKTIKSEEQIDVKMLKNDGEKITKPIVIPSELNNEKTVKIQQKTIQQEEVEPNLFEEETEEHLQEEETMSDLFEEEVVETPKRGRGRPRKNINQNVEEDKPKKGRGRPKKEELKKDDEGEDEFDIDLFNLDSNDDANDENQTDTLPDDMDFDLFSMEQDDDDKQEETLDEETYDVSESYNNDSDDVDLFNIGLKEDKNKEDNSEDTFTINNEQNVIKKENNNVESDGNNYIETTIKNSAQLNTLLTSEKKIVAFVGTTKNGTSFVVNNLALTLASMDISTAILDMTRNKNSYYIFTKNEENLRKIAENSVANLEKGICNGIKVEKNLTVYTEIPGENTQKRNIENMLVTLMEKHDIVLIDTDFNTDIQCFALAQEIYLVQSMDVLTIQPLTAFLRNLKMKSVLRPEKIKIVINKAQNLRTLTDSILIGGISSYNDPTMTLMTDLFNKDNVIYCKIPFEVQNYIKYLDSLVNCEIYLRGYTKSLIIAFNSLAEIVYPLLTKTKYVPNKKSKKRMEFSDMTRNTLNKMKKNY